LLKILAAFQQTVQDGLNPPLCSSLLLMANITDGRPITGVAVRGSLDSLELATVGACML